MKILVHLIYMLGSILFLLGSGLSLYMELKK